MKLKIIREVGIGLVVVCIVDGKVLAYSRCSVKTIDAAKAHLAKAYDRWTLDGRTAPLVAYTGMVGVAANVAL